MRKFGARSLIVALLALVTVGLTASAGATNAMACGSEQDSRAFAAALPQVNPGDRGPEVRGMQHRLAELGYGLRGTGLYADNTLGAVKDFQRKHGINDSGIVGAKTWQKLVGVLPLGRTSTPAEELHQMQPGAHNPRGVELLAIYFERLPNAGAVPAWGSPVYHQGWQQVVREFQRSVGINDSGIVGVQTWRALARVTAVAGQWGC
ncbi:peptidoglycan-binding domain-containing protein [Crossiella cryophila]|uniref:Murein L,D-transpeptidase YcbB/YkuD n=1 Tax=Crossiella cryophila TaxID=43355 RepID=A0A7W7FR80_9PSEU|nr:peptidoglycan-binding protein [Crossiella cryophila]MBB4674645.1 murein L,D-transpeptidase YcbB/YkuD [Crossiella cryophila]